MKNILDGFQRVQRHLAIADDDRQGVQSGKLGCVLTTVPGNDLVATLRCV